MNRRRYRTWAAWLLPLLVLRAFLPVGFMLAADAGGLQLVFCPAQTASFAHGAASTAASTAFLQQAVDGLAADAQLPHAAHHGGAHGDSGRLEAPCPYGLATVALSIAVPLLEAAVQRPTEAPPVEDSSFVACAGPHRVDLIRGPPALS